MSGRRVVLIAGMGTSPAVLTCTVWALAHQREPVIPDEIVILTTKSAKTKFVTEVFEGANSVWSRMLQALAKEGIDVEGKLACGEASIVLVADHNHNYADDLRNGDDNLSAADSMLGVIRKYTSDPDTIVLTSIAGGRKTMTALLFSCMTLLGRKDDKVYHVLIPPEYEGRLNPTFYFPEKGLSHEVVGQKKKVPSVKVGIELFEVPYVRVRGWFQEKFKTPPPSYRALVDQVQSIAPPAVTIPRVEIDAWNALVRINGVEVRPGANEFAALLVLAGGVGNVEEIYRRLHRLKYQKETGCCDWIERFASQTKYASPYDDDAKLANQEVSKTMSRLRKSFESKGLGGLESLVPQRGRGVAYPISQIVWHGKGRMMDICGYLISPTGKEDVL